MTLSQRLKEAEYERRLAAGLPVDHLVGNQDATSPGSPRVDLSQSAGPVIDLTGVRPAHEPPARHGVPRPDAAGSGAPALSPIRAVPDPDEAPSPFAGLQIGERSSVACPQCGGLCQIDLIDQVGQAVGLSCLSCFHMFRVDI